MAKQLTPAQMDVLKRLAAGETISRRSSFGRWSTARMSRDTLAVSPATMLVLENRKAIWGRDEAPGLTVYRITNIGCALLSPRPSHPIPDAATAGEGA
jgi:hypothetical protein